MHKATTYFSFANLNKYYVKFNSIASRKNHGEFVSNIRMYVTCLSNSMFDNLEFSEAAKI